MAQRSDGTVRRGDNIPSIADYAHHNEDAAAVWYAENRYDMEHADEIIDQDEFYAGGSGACPNSGNAYEDCECEECIDG